MTPHTVLFSFDTVQSTDIAPPAWRITARTIQIGFGIIWLADGLLQLQPKMFGTAFANGVILPSAQGQPAIISSVITHAAHLMAAQPVLTDSSSPGSSSSSAPVS